MKRYAILLGHNDGIISTPLDLSRMKSFLMSNKGGAWRESEIYCKQNISYSTLISLIATVKSEEYDYLLFYFSGHGEYRRNTVIELNPKHETIEERFLSKLAVRQLNIFDCCRAEEDDSVITESMESIRNFSAQRESATIRRMYDNRIIAALPQQMSLYSCRIGEYSNDFGDGGIFTTHLLESVDKFNDDFLLVSEALSFAYQPTIDEAAKHGEKQTPDYFMPKFRSSQQLIFAINDKYTRSL